MLVSTHDLASLRQFADEALLLRGDILMHDTPEKVLAPENLVRAFGMEVDAGASVATGAAAPGAAYLWHYYDQLCGREELNGTSSTFWWSR